jgi:RNA polymerase sigma factor (sigma-70 family)
LRVHVEAELREPPFRAPAEIVVAQCREELASTREARDLPRDDGPSTGRLRQHGLALHDLPGPGHVRNQHELDPFDVTDDRTTHGRIIAERRPGVTIDRLTAADCSPLQDMMEAVAQAIPPFERFYLEHRDEVLGYLRRLLGQRAEDAWQETFLRALRGYDRLRHGRHLRAWVFTIATNVAMDELRAKPVDAFPDAVEPAVELRRDAFRELEDLTDGLPPTERVAVVLRYGYDLPYDAIGSALGSNEVAARAAASSGVRRLRRTHERHT